MKYIILNKLTKARWEADTQGLTLVYDCFMMVDVMAALNKSGKYEDKYRTIITKQTKIQITNQ